MASKLNTDRLKAAIQGILEQAKEKKRNFLETIELQIGLKDYDLTRDKRFAGTVRLPSVPRPNMKICVLGDARHCDMAEKLGLPTRSLDDLKKLNKVKKLVKKLADDFDAFLASSDVLKNLTRVLGPGLNKAGKFPILLNDNDDIMARVNEVKSQVKFQMKKVLCMGVAIGNVGMTSDEIRQNSMIAINFFVSLLKKNWHNVKTLHMKSSMGKCHRIFG